MGSSEGWGQTHASATRQSNMRFAAKTPIAVAVIGICPITRICVAPKPSRDVPRRWRERGTGKGPSPGPASAGASSTAQRTPPDLAGSGEHRRGRVGRHWNTVAQLGFVHLWLRSRAGCPLGANRGVAVVAVLLILEREEVPGTPLDDWQGLGSPDPKRPDSEPQVARKAANRLLLRRPGNLMCDLPPKRQ